MSLNSLTHLTFQINYKVRQQISHDMSLSRKFKRVVKSILIFFLILFSLFDLSAQSINFGVLATANSSSYAVKSSADERNDLSYPLNYGGSIGLSLRYGPSKQQVSRKVPFRPTFQTEGKLASTILLIQSTNDQTNFEKETYEITRFEFNLMGGAEYKGKFQLLFGPTFNTILEAKKTEDFKVGESRDFPESDREFKRFGIGINTSLGFLWKNFLFSVQYERQVTDFRTSLSNVPVSFKMNTLRIGTTFFLFNKNNEKNKDSIFGL